MSDELRSTNILVVDDDRAFGRALRAALTRRGHTVALAHDYDEALAEAAAWKPERAVVDLKMPGRGGLEVVQALLQLEPRTRIVVLTAYGSIATAVEAIKLGATHYLTKPTDADTILAAFDRVGADIAVDVGSRHMPLDVMEWEHLSQVLRDCGGNVSEAARRLGMHRRTLQRKLARKRGD